MNHRHQCICPSNHKTTDRQTDGRTLTDRQPLRQATLAESAQTDIQIKKKLVKKKKVQAAKCRLLRKMTDDRVACGLF